jgi:polysaccharide biosynthesis protein PslE
MTAPRLDWLVVILVRRWRWMAAITLVCALGMLAALPFLTKQYEITARLLFKPGREQAPHAVVGGAAAGTAFRRTEDVTSEAEIIAGQPLIEALVRDFGPDYFLARKAPVTLWEQIKDAARSVVRWVRETISEVMILVGLEKRLTPFEKVVSLLQFSLRAEPVRRADVMEVTLRMPDQQAGVDVMTRLIELYIDAHIKAFKTPGATQFLVERVDALKQELAMLEDRRRKFSQEFALWDLDEQRRGLLAQQRDLRQAQSRTMTEIGRLQAELDQAKQTLAVPPMENRVSRVEQVNPVVQALNTRIADQRTRIEKLRLVFSADSRRVADEEAELVQLEKQLSEQKRSVTQSETFSVSEGYRDTERGLAEKQGRLAGMHGQQQRQVSEDERLTAQLSKMDGQAELSRQLSRDLALAEQNYQLYVRRLEEARIADALDAAAISNVSVIGHPTASVRPVAPRSMLLFIGALAAGLLGSFGFFVVRDALRPTIHSREQAAELLGAPVLARLPEVRL